MSESKETDITSISTTSTEEKTASRKRKSTSTAHPLFLDNPAINEAKKRLKAIPIVPIAAPVATTTIAQSRAATIAQSLAARLNTAFKVFVPDTRCENATLTEKGAYTFSTSDSHCLDLFFNGFVRGCDHTRLLSLLSASWTESPLHTLQLIAHSRDCRGGKGERLVSFQALLWLRQHKPASYLSNLLLFLQCGCFKDLLTIAEMALKSGLPPMGAEEFIELEIFAQFLLHDQQTITTTTTATATTTTTTTTSTSEEKKDPASASVSQSISLAAKWCPSEGSHFDKAPLRFAHRLARSCFPSSSTSLRQYRNLCSTLRSHLNIVERSMCRHEWSLINFSSVPSKAHHILKAAFKRHDAERYQAYLESVKSGKSEIKSTGLQPHELIHHYYRPYNRSSQEEVNETVELQWKDLVEKLRVSGSLSSCLAVVDVSGSMTSGGSGSGVAPIEPAIALGLLVAELTAPPWQGRVLTFHEEPSWHILPSNSSLKARVDSLSAAPWGGTTNLQSTFDLILSLAVQYNLPATAMPSTLFIFSDMQFDTACGRGHVTNFQMIQTKYNLAGYHMPSIIFWNLTGRCRDSPVKKDENGVCMLSGYSGELLKCIMNGKDLEEMSPYKTMLMAIDKYTVEVVEAE